MPDQKTHDAIPSVLTLPCTIDYPPTEEELKDAWMRFPTATNVWEARYLVMYDAYFGQTGNLIDCDLQMGSVRLWDKQHLEMTNETRTAPK